MHQDAFTFPQHRTDWAEMGVSPIGIVKDGEGDWFALAIDGKRQPFIVDEDGAHALDKEVAGPAIYQALDETCEALWGHSWNSAIGEIFRINRRTTQRDRVSKYLLPPRILQIIAYVATSDDREELAGALVAIARYAARSKSKAETLSYWQNVADVFYGDNDEQMGVEVAKKAGPGTVP